MTGYDLLPRGSIEKDLKWIGCSMDGRCHIFEKKPKMTNGYWQMKLPGKNYSLDTKRVLQRGRLYRIVSDSRYAKYK